MMRFEDSGILFPSRPIVGIPAYLGFTSNYHTLPLTLGAAVVFVLAVLMVYLRQKWTGIQGIVTHRQPAYQLLRRQHFSGGMQCNVMNEIKVDHSHALLQSLTKGAVHV